VDEDAPDVGELLPERVEGGRLGGELHQVVGLLGMDDGHGERPEERWATWWDVEALDPLVRNRSLGSAIR
jgi:hypothetical protein